ncbi:phosphotransferase family protein [Streptomyces sp. NPDC088760]|uniref:phosphotransferase family protein n=1 Tax=Streptomyces sp. NPDC088760 TaxID=3365890 RepID=UPI003810B287
MWSVLVSSVGPRARPEGAQLSGAPPHVHALRAGDGSTARGRAVADDTGRRRRRQGVSSATTSGLLRAPFSGADSLSDELLRPHFAPPRAVIHGDAHVGSMLRAPEGHAVLCDLDFICLGPPEWDLMPEFVGYLRYGRPWADYQRLSDAYGFDPRTWDGLPTLIQVHALNDLTVVLPLLRTHPSRAHRIGAPHRSRA